MRRSLAALGLVLAGCATVINDQKETIAVSSEPTGAVATVNCGPSAMYGGLTPASILIERTAHPCAFTIAKDGHREKHVELRRRTSAPTLGNKRPGVIAGSLLSAVGLLLTPD